MSRRTAVAVWLAALVLVLVATLPALEDLSDHGHWERVVWIPFADPHGGVVEILANVLLFIPFGWAATRTVGGTSGVVVAGLTALALSGAVEVVQIFSHGRFATSRDVVANLAGALVGALIAYRQAGDRATGPGR